MILVAVKYLMCVAGGAVLGYFYAYGRLERDFQKRLADETYELRDHYRLRYENKTKQAEEPVESDPGEILRQMYEGAPAKPTVETTGVTPMAEKGAAQGDIEVAEEAKANLEKLHNPAVREIVLDAVVDNLGHRIDKRTEGSVVEKKPTPPAVNYNKISTPPKTEPEKPKEGESEIQIELIDKQAFVDDQFGYKQYSFTYFVGDDVLANESDEALSAEKRALSVGEEALRKLRIGQAELEGESTIYVRNRTGKWEFEVIRSEGKYSEEVGAESG